jgi:putative transposase
MDQPCLLNPPHRLRVHVLLVRNGWAINAKRVFRLYRDLGLHLLSNTLQRRVKAKLREGRTEARKVNETREMGALHDQLATGRKDLRADDRRHLLAVLASDRCAVLLSRRGSRANAGKPKSIRVDRGSEFISGDRDLWAY